MTTRQLFHSTGLLVVQRQDLVLLDRFRVDDFLQSTLLIIGQIVNLNSRLQAAELSHFQCQQNRQVERVVAGRVERFWLVRRIAHGEFNDAFRVSAYDDRFVGGELHAERFEMVGDVVPVEVALVHG